MIQQFLTQYVCRIMNTTEHENTFTLHTAGKVHRPCIRLKSMYILTLRVVHILLYVPISLLKLCKVVYVCVDISNTKSYFILVLYNRIITYYFESIINIKILKRIIVIESNDSNHVI